MICVNILLRALYEVGIANCKSLCLEKIQIRLVQKDISETFPRQFFKNG